MFEERCLCFLSENVIFYHTNIPFLTNELDREFILIIKYCKIILTAVITRTNEKFRMGKPNNCYSTIIIIKKNKQINLFNWANSIRLYKFIGQGPTYGRLGCMWENKELDDRAKKLWVHINNSRVRVHNWRFKTNAR